MKTTSEKVIPVWSQKWNAIRKSEMKEARSLAEEHAQVDTNNAYSTIFYLLRHGEQPAVKMTHDAFEVLSVDSDGKEARYASCNFDYIKKLCPDAKVEFFRIYHLILKQVYGDDMELNKLYKLVPDPIASEYVPNITK